MSTKVNELVDKVKKARAVKKEQDALIAQIEELKNLVSEKTFKVIDEQKLSELFAKAVNNTEILSKLDKEADYTQIIKALAEVKEAVEASVPEPVKEVTVSNIGDAPVAKTVEVSNFPEQKEFPDEINAKLVGKPEFSELEPDNATKITRTVV